MCGLFYVYALLIQELLAHVLHGLEAQMHQRRRAGLGVIASSIMPTNTSGPMIHSGPKVRIEFMT
jgi:hypothetical protein